MDFDTKALELALAERAATLKLGCAAEELRLAESIARRARELVAPHRDTGQTEESIHVEHGEGGAEVHGRNRYLEFGTSNMAARPFMRPAIAEGAKDLHPPHF